MKLVAILVLAGACSKTNPYYCPGHPDNNCTLDASADAAPHCMSSADCPGNVCDPNSGACVQCTVAMPAACMGSTPTCGTDDKCHKCDDNSQCASAACLPDGSCGDASNVAYVDETGSGSTCTMQSPCGQVSTALATMRPNLKLTGTITEAVSITDRNVTILAAPGAILTRGNTGPILTVNGTSIVQIYDLEITGATGSSSGVGILMPTGGSSTVVLNRAKIKSCQALGVSAQSGTFDAYRTRISLNTGGGISLNGAAFELIDDMIDRNGSGGSAFGGVYISQITGGGPHVLEFDTLSRNTAGITTSGVLCSAVVPSLTFSDDIIYANQGSGANTQVFGSNCNYTYSDVGPDTISGTGNINMDPMFVDPTDFHVMPSSPVRDMGDPAATVSVDIDGAFRPQGAGFDIGAQELKP